MKLIALSGKRGLGKYAAVSDEDFEYLNQWKWFQHADGYACRTEYGERTSCVMMHREVARMCGFDRGSHVDHRHQDKLDNCRHAIRPATPTQNNMNRGANVCNRLGVKGVRETRNGTYEATIHVNGSQRYLGVYKSIEEASLRRRTEEKNLFGEYAGY